MGLAFFQALQHASGSPPLSVRSLLHRIVLTVLKRLLLPSIDFVLGTKHLTSLSRSPWPCEGRPSDRRFTFEGSKASKVERVAQSCRAKLRFLTSKFMEVREGIPRHTDHPKENTFINLGVCLPTISLKDFPE